MMEKGINLPHQVVLLCVWSLLVAGFFGMTGCNRKTSQSHSPAVGTWMQKRPANPIILKFNADGTGSQTLGVEPNGTRLAEPFTWTEVNGLIAYEIRRSYLMPAQTVTCTLSQNKKTIFWGKRGQIALNKQ